MSSHLASITVGAPPSEVVAALRAELLGTESSRRAAHLARETFVDGAIDLSSFHLRLMNHTVRGSVGVCSGWIEAADSGGTTIRFDGAGLSSAWIILAGGLTLVALVLVAQWPEIIGAGEGYFMPGMWPVMLTMIVGVTALAALVSGSGAREANRILRDRIQGVLAESTSGDHAPSA